MQKEAVGKILLTCKGVKKMPVASVLVFIKNPIYVFP